MSLVEGMIPDVGDAEEVKVIEICVSASDNISSGDTLIVIDLATACMALTTD